MKKQIILCLLIALSTRLAASVLVMNGLTHVHNTHFGGQVTGKIVVRNESKKESRILVYKQDLIANCGKPTEYTDFNKHNRSLGNWLQTNVDEKLLSPNEEYTIHYTINLPKEDIEKGTYWAVLMVEGADPIKEEQNNGMQINSKVRYAIQVLADVGGFASPELLFEDVKFDSTEQVGKMIKVKLRNGGAFSTKAKLSLEIFSSKGEKIKTVEALQKRLYPNYCNDFDIPLTNLPKGKYEGVLVADNGKDMFGSNITFEIQ